MTQLREIISSTPNGKRHMIYIANLLKFEDTQWIVWEKSLDKNTNTFWHNKE